MKSASGLSLLRLLMVVFTLACLLTGCGGGGGEPVGATTGEQETISGKVIDGYISAAVVCIDLNANGHCDDDESQTRSDGAGAYKLTIPKNSQAPLLAEVYAGLSIDSDHPGIPVATSYRMASPSKAYSTLISPYTTLVHLTAEKNFPLAEDLVRNTVGLPSRFGINVDYVGTPGSLRQTVAQSVATALIGPAGRLEFASTSALAEVVAGFPGALTALPELRINTKNSAPITSKETYVDATFSLTNPAVSTQAAALNGKIRGRGHSTWGQPKNPYKVQFTNDASYAKIPDVVGMTKNRNWALLADYFDKSLMRNKLALSLANSSVFSDGLKWSPSGQHVEVYLNSDYLGVYLLAEDIRIAQSRLNIKSMSSDPAVGDFDGGYIVEVDLRLDCYNDGSINLQHVTPQGVRICIDTPDESAITPKQLSLIKSALDAVETDLYGPNRLDRINRVSFADWYLLNELFRNNDAAFLSSVFMWKDTDAAANPLDRLLNIGPIWDFDISAGNINYNGNWQAEGCWVSKAGPSPNWYTKLFDNAEFVQLTISRWKQKRAALQTFVNTSIDTYAQRLASAQQRNYVRWQTLGLQLWPNYYIFSSYAEEVAFLKQFLNDRMRWLDQAFASPGNFQSMCK